MGLGFPKPLNPKPARASGLGNLEHGSFGDWGGPSINPNCTDPPWKDARKKSQSTTEKARLICRRVLDVGCCASWLSTLNPSDREPYTQTLSPKRQAPQAQTPNPKSENHKTQPGLFDEAIRLHGTKGQRLQRIPCTRAWGLEFGKSGGRVLNFGYRLGLGFRI